MLVLDALFDHILQISSNVEITGDLVQFAQLRQLMPELGHSRPNRAVRVMCGVAPLAAEQRASEMGRFVLATDTLASLFDHLVCPREQRGRYREA